MQIMIVSHEHIIVTHREGGISKTRKRVQGKLNTPRDYLLIKLDKRDLFM